MRQIFLEMLADLALQLDSGAVLDLKEKRRLRIFFWLVLSLQILFILFLTGITFLLFIVGWDTKQWGLPALGLVCLICLYLQVARTAKILRDFWKR